MEGVVDNVDDSENMETTDRDDITEAVEDIEQYESQEEMLGSYKTPEKIEELIDRLGFLPMTVEIFQKMRDTFGSEECEFCGRLFMAKVDYEYHVRTHTGRYRYAI